ncbi:glycosyltransferase family 8 C-terminal domain-containing protein [Escherichia coli]
MKPVNSNQLRYSAKHMLKKKSNISKDLATIFCIL